MQKLFWLVTCTALSCLTLFMAGPAYSANEDAKEIMERSYHINGGKDSLTRLTFTFHTPDNQPRKLIMTMASKNFHGKKNLASKSIMFNEFPPDTKGTSYMAWLYEPGANKEDDMWLYLPELRSIRKLPQNHEQAKNKKSNDNTDELFSNSELGRDELVPRYPDMDDHRLIKKETTSGTEAYIIESTPKDQHTAPYGKTLRWVTTDNFLPTRIEYYDHEGKLFKEQTFEWKKIKNAWLWDKVIAINKITGNKTILEQTNIKVDIGLKDTVFSKRMMKLGATSFLSSLGY